MKGIKSIVDVGLKDEGNPDVGDSKKVEDGSTAGDNNAAAGILFVNNTAGVLMLLAKKSAADAAKIVGAVTGYDILRPL